MTNTNYQHRQVLLIASSGGGAATLGHTNPETLCQRINDELQTIQGQLAGVLYVALPSGKSMDLVGDWKQAKAIFYELSPEGNHCRVAMEGSLQEVNDECRKRQCEFAQRIRQNKVDALISISSSVDIFRETFQAAASRQIPVTGSGGTSLSQASTLFPLRLVGNAGGSVATTSYTRSISYISSLAKVWGVPYQPWARPVQGPSVISVLNSTLPAFWATMLCKFTLRQYPFILNFIHNNMNVDASLLMALLENTVLPTACALAMATSSETPETPTSSIVMAVALTIPVCRGSILAGIVAGWLVSRVLKLVLFWSILHNVPATMMSLLSGGGSGILVSVLVAPMVGVLSKVSSIIRLFILSSTFVTQPNILLRCTSGFLWGCFSCYASKVGWYHSFMLPLTLIEMEHGDPSFLGAVDHLTLVMVCAGITAAQLVGDFSQRKLSKSDRDFFQRAFITNVTCGDFIEACYPSMERSILINIGGYLASGLSCAWLLIKGVDIPKGSAYLPLPLSVAIAGSRWTTMGQASLISFIVSFAFTLLAAQKRRGY